MGVMRCRDLSGSRGWGSRAAVVRGENRLAKAAPSAARGHGRCLLLTCATGRGREARKDQSEAQSPAAPKEHSRQRREQRQGPPSEHSPAPGAALAPTHRGVVQDDVAAGHVPVQKVLLQVLDEGALGRRGP